MFTVISKEGTEIAYDKVGSGPAVILVDGALAVRASGTSLAELLAPNFRVYYYDRRGRGDSTDTNPYFLEKEVEDLEALIDVAGGSVYLYGSSSGGALALETAIRLGDKIKKLAVYEVPYDSSEAGVKAWREYRAKLSEFLAADRRGDAVALFMKFVGVPDDALESMRQAPTWQSMEALAPTLAYDSVVVGEDRIVPTERAASISAQTLVMDGSASYEPMPFMRATAKALAKAIPNAQHQVLEGQGHDVDPNVLAPVLKEHWL